MRILFIGDAWLGSNARSLANGFRGLGHNVVHVDTSSVNKPPRWTPDWFRLKATGSRNPAAIADLHSKIDEVRVSFRPEVLFCFKTIHLNQERLTNIQGVRSIHYSADDVSNPYNTTSNYLKYEREWHAVVTTKTHNLRELAGRGVSNPIFVPSAYDPYLHHPVARRYGETYDVGFLGNRRPDREELIRNMADKFGGRFAVGGPGWSDDRSLRRSQSALLPSAYGEELSYFVASVRANLVLLNSDNRDSHTCRSYEVPAAGGLFVGERTAEHEELLADGTEGYMFSSEEELHELVAAIQADPKKATEVASRGYRRIVSGRNTYQDRAAEILSRAL